MNASRLLTFQFGVHQRYLTELSTYLHVMQTDVRRWMGVLYDVSVERVDACVIHEHDVTLVDMTCLNGAGD